MNIKDMVKDGKQVFFVASVHILKQTMLRQANNRLDKCSPEAYIFITQKQEILLMGRPNIDSMTPDQILDIGYANGYAAAARDCASVRVLVSAEIDAYIALGIWSATDTLKNNSKALAKLVKSKQYENTATIVLLET